MKLCNSCRTEVLAHQETTECMRCNKVIHKDCAINDDGTFCDVCYTLKQQEEVSNPVFDGTIPDVIRRSYIETYKSCPHKFYLQVIKGHDMPPNIYTQLGIDLHDMFDYASNNRDFTENDMVTVFNEHFATYDDMFTEIADKETMYKRGIDSIETFYHVTADMPKPFQTEETLQFSVGEGLPIVQATSDRINMVDGRLHMMDWKTGGVMTGVKLSSDLQAPLYIYSVQQKYNLPVESFTFYYLKDNKERIYHRINDDNYVCRVGKREYKINITDAIREVQHIFSQIKKGNFNIPINTKGMYFTCKMCHLKEQELCEGADMQVWNQFNRKG